MADKFWTPGDPMPSYHWVKYRAAKGRVFKFVAGNQLGKYTTDPIQATRMTKEEADSTAALLTRLGYVAIASRVN